MLRRRRLEDGTFGPLEEVFPQSQDPNLVAAFEAIAMQFEAIDAQQEQIESLKAEIELLKGGNA